jgi:large subunit ribosomal protein L4
MRRAALCSALSAKAASGDIVVLDRIEMAAPKTKEMAQMMERLVGKASVVLVLPGRNDVVEQSAHNIPDVKALHAHYLNIRDLLGHNKLVLAADALDVLAGFLGSDQKSEE